MTAPRDPARIEPTLDAVRELWSTVPDWRLGQLIVNAVGRDIGELFYVEDDVLVERLRAAMEQVSGNRGA